MFYLRRPPLLSIVLRSRDSSERSCNVYFLSMRNLSVFFVTSRMYSTISFTVSHVPLFEKMNNCFIFYLTKSYHTPHKWLYDFVSVCVCVSVHLCIIHTLCVYLLFVHVCVYIYMHMCIYFVRVYPLPI